MANELLGFATICAVIISIILAKRFGTAKAQADASVAWRGLADTRREELVDLRNRYELLLADVRSELDRMRVETATLRDDKAQLAELNRHLMGENADLRARVSQLEAKVGYILREQAAAK